ncbi:MAG: GTPase HflX [Hyphomicrobiales bacterium]|nr:MAG: GTPase HflX [Hyphomicrobiales bacterium]
MSEFEKGGKPRFQIDTSEERPADRTLIIVPILTGAAKSKRPGLAVRSDEARLEEATGLARAIELDIVHSGLVSLSKIKPATLLGKGKVEEFKGMVASLDAGLVVIDHPLTPVQQRNLEEAWNVKVIDRTGLILEIFGARAQTKEGRLQVDLAHLNYQRGRLVRSWTHLERQRGGVSTVGGPGETQIESDRRQLQDRITKIKKELEKVRRTRTLHRSKRQKIPHPIVALVGYTNAGKSTLFNRVTGAKVLAKDMLFTTLDPTLRRLELPKGTLVILSDTVGFVSDLPTHLVAAFRATLEEVIEADLILHVRDIADADTRAQAHDVYSILQQLGVEEQGHKNVLEVWNKTDLLDTEALEAIRATRSGDNAPLLTSAITGEGLDSLLVEIETRISTNDSLLEFDLPLTAMGHLNWIYENAQVIDRQDLEDGTLHLTVRVPGAVKDALMAKVA